MKRNLEVLKKVLLALVALAFLFELVRDCQRDGDFIGYVNAGNAVLNGTNIYSDYLNTWPPFFSIFSVPIALFDSISPIGTRLIWLMMIIVSWFFIIQCTLRLGLGRRLRWFNTTDSTDIKITDWAVLLPFLFVLRFVIDDLSNIQINSFMLLACLFVVKQHINGGWLIGGVVLGLIIALKVYPIFLLFFLVYKSSYKLVATGVATIAFTVLLSILVFDVEVALSYYQDWIGNKALAPTIITHKNQSFFPLSEAFFANQTRGLNIYYNLFDMPISVAKRIAYGVIGFFGLVVLAIFYQDKRTFKRFREFEQFSVVLAVIPIISPLAWKYYFVFLFPLYVMVYHQLFTLNHHRVFLKVAFFLSLALSILSTDGLLGVWFSDVLEVFGCITLATIVLVVTFLSSKLIQNESRLW